MIIVPAGAARAQGFTVTTLDFISPISINDASQILGGPLPYGAGLNILDLASGQITHLTNVPSSPAAFNKTKIVGTYLSGTTFNSFKPFLYDIQSRTYAAVDTPPSIVNPQTYALNNSTQLVGTYTASNHVAVFFWSGGAWTTLNPPSSCSFSPTGINDLGDIVGVCPGTGNPGAFLFSKGVWTEILPPPEIQSKGGSWTVNGINNAGMIIGSYTADVGTPKGFVLIRGKWLTYEIPGASWLNPTGINNRGEITGQYAGSSGARGYVTVVPATVASPKNFGPCVCSSTSAGQAEGNPINVGTGNKFQSETDLEGVPTTGIALQRFFNSQDTTATAFGTGWRSTWDRSLRTPNANTVEVARPDGRRETFSKNASGSWVSDPDVTSRLSAVIGAGAAQTGWQLTQPNDDVESYDLLGRLTGITSRAGLKTTLTYDAAGKLTKVTGPFGHTLTYAYDATGKVSQVTAPDGQLTKYGYDAKSNLISVTFPDGKRRQYVYENTSFPNALTGIIDENGTRFATYAYDAQGRAVSTEHAGGVEKTAVAYAADGAATITQPNGATRAYAFRTQFDLVKPAALTGTPSPSVGGKAFEYDANGFISKLTDYSGNVTTYVHDARGLETSRTEAFGTPLARTITTTWHPTFHLPAQINEPGRTISFSYDAKGNLTKKTITAGTLSRSWAYTYSALGQVLSVDGPRAGTIDLTRYTYDGKGNLATVTDALGRVSKFTGYDANGRLLQMQDPNGLVTANAYDARGRLVSRTVGGEVTKLAYDAAGQFIKLTRPDASYLALTYDAAHRLTSVADATGNKVVYTLDATGNVSKEEVRDTAGTVRRTQSHLYDQVNRLAQDIGAAGQKTLYAHDANGNLTGVTDPLGHATANTFDALDRLVKVKDAAGGTTAYGYDANDRLTKVIDPRALATAYAYDGLDNRTQVQSPDTGKTTSGYDAAGNVTIATDARGTTTTYAYDALNRLTSASASDGTKVSYFYDQGVNGLGRLTGMTDPAGSTNWAYDPHGRVIQRKQQIGTLVLTTGYSYDAAGRRIGMTYPSGKTLTFAYDTVGRVKSIAAGTQTLLSAVAYEPFGPVAGWTIGTGAAYTIARDKDGDPTSLKWGTGATVFRSVQLGYDADKRITSFSDSAAVLASYGYDKLERLTGYTAGTANQAFTYDADSNRSGLVANAVTTSYQYPAASNRLASRSEGAVTTAYTYDAAGNLTGDGSRTYGYDGRGRLVKVTIGGAITQYAVNGLGQRVGKTGAAVPTGRNLYVYDEAGHLIGEYDNTGKLLKEYVWLGDLPVALLTPTATYYVFPDHLGAPWTVVDGAGKLVWSWGHDPFGTTQPTGTITYNLRFPGQYYDKETGLHYNYHRDYDSKLGRYVQSDPIGLAGGVNTYAYVAGNPVLLQDRSGLAAPGSFSPSAPAQPLLLPAPEQRLLLSPPQPKAAHVPASRPVVEIPEEPGGVTSGVLKVYAIYEKIKAAISSALCLGRATNAAEAVTKSGNYLCDGTDINCQEAAMRAWISANTNAQVGVPAEFGKSAAELIEYTQ